MLRMEIALFLVLAFVAYMYFSAEKEHSALHSTFAGLLVTVLVYGYALGASFSIARIVWVFVGVIFAAVGNYLPKIRRNTLTGIRLPWTLMDDAVWNKTHRFSGPVWVLGGLLLIVCGLIGTGPALPVAAIVVVIAVPTAYSLAVSLKKKA